MDSESKLTLMLSEQYAAIKNLIDLSYRLGSKPDLFMKRFRELVIKTKMPDNLWKDFMYFVNLKYNNVIQRISEIHPSLKEEELYFISLVCCDFSYIEIAICMGYTNNNYVNNKKVRIAQKMGIDEPLKDYICRVIAM